MVLAAVATALATTATVVAVVSLSRVSASADEAVRNARASCVRSRTFGPALARAYERYRILKPAELKAYRASLPRRCK